MPNWLTALLTISGSMAIVGFIEFMIKRYDNKKGLMAQLMSKVDLLRADFEEEKAINARTRILRFADELMHEKRHSKEYFDQILEDVDKYKKYCDDHPKFENSKAVASIARIKSVYARRLEENDFE